MLGRGRRLWKGCLKEDVAHGGPAENDFLRTFRGKDHINYNQCTAVLIVFDVLPRKKNECSLSRIALQVLALYSHSLLQERDYIG